MIVLQRIIKSRSTNILLALFVVFVSAPLFAQSSDGWVNGGLLLNDSFGLQEDRWQSSSFSEGYFYLKNGQPTNGFVIGTRTITPDHIGKPDPAHDRPYAEMITLDCV